MIWIDGQVHEGTRVPFNLADRGLLLADGLFETLLVVGGVPFRLDAHLARLRSGAAVLRMPVDLGMVEQAMAALAARFVGAGVVRVTVTRGTGPRGLALPPEQHPTVFATAAPWSPALAFGRQRLAVSAIPRNDRSPLSRIKSLAYLDNVLAFDRAVASGADDALMLSTRGRVACTSAANLFVLDGDRLVTPPPDDGVLPGTMRALLLEIAPRCGLEAVERSVTLDEVRGADAVLTTSSVRLISTVLALDDRPLRERRADVVADLSRALRAVIALDCASELPPGSGSG